jgi:CheY-like chemotaxis protein
VKKKILIVEGNNDSLEILGLRVTKFGYEAIKARNSKEAITYAEQAECISGGHSTTFARDTATAGELDRAALPSHHPKVIESRDRSYIA